MLHTPDSGRTEHATFRIITDPPLLRERFFPQSPRLDKTSQLGDAGSDHSLPASAASFEVRTSTS